MFRVQFAAKLDPRIHFALFSAAKTSSAVGIFSGKTLEKELQQSTEGFLAEEVIINPVKKEVRKKKCENIKFTF
jgi:hypothetical protein